MHVRKLVKSGLASYTIALPKAWIEKHRLKKGEMLYIDETEKGLIVSPAPQKEEPRTETEIVVDVDKLDSRRVHREIVAGYLNNCSQIRLKGASITKYAEDIKEFSSNLIGMELIEEDSKKIVLRSFVHLADANPNQILRRIDNIIRSMIIDSKSIAKDPSLVEVLLARDQSVNKFVFLLRRVTKGAITDDRIARELALSPKEALVLWEVALHLEKVGDGVKRYARNVRELVKSKKLEPRVLALIADFQRAYEETMKSYYTSDVELGDEVVSQRDALTKKADAFEEETGTVPAAHFASKLKTMLAHLADITRFTRFSR